MKTVVPMLLQHDNVTPQARTPWGGSRLGKAFKHGLDGQTIGESWELSVEPDYPSHVGDATGPRLDEVVRSDPSAWLGYEHRRGRPSTALLVKLLDTAAPLSVQIHPADDDPTLADDESGKPESWYVVDREPGAGLYIGFARATERAVFEQTLRAGEPIEHLLGFVTVEPGDFFLIDAGTPHAIGAGVTLVEPQRVLPGKRGVTYRYWDWNRRYDALGQPDPAGKARALHLEEAISVTRWAAPREDALLNEIRIEDRPDPAGPASRVTLAGNQSGLLSSSLSVDRISGTGATPFSADDHLRALTVIQGAATLTAADSSLTVVRGRTAVIPASFTGGIALDGCLAIVSAAL